MKKILLLIVLSISVEVFAQYEGEEYCSHLKAQAYSKIQKLSKTAYPGDSNIDVTYYRLNLKVTANPNLLEGKVTVKGKPTINSLSNFFLDLKNNLIVSKVLSNLKELSYTQTSDNKLLITLERNYIKGEEFSVDIYYSGVPTAGTGTISSASFSFFDSGANKVTIASLSEPYGSRDWWPSKDTPADKVDSSEVLITCASNLYAVSNGKLTAIIDNNNGTKTYCWKNSYPIANYLISIAVSEYSIFEDEYINGEGKRLPLIHYNYPSRLTDSRKYVLSRTKNMLKFYSEKFGDYPFMKEKYAHAEFSWGGGMEHQTCTSMGGGAMNSESTIAHELAHQWFGDKVTCKDWQNIWLNEGFATYLDKLYHEDAYGKSYFNQLMNTVFTNAKRATGTIYVQNINNEAEIFSSARSYNKGAAVLHMLRGIVGDEKFFRIMKEYANEPGLTYSVAVTEDFQNIAQRVTQSDLSYFFQEWIYGENYPKYTVGSNISKLNDGSYKVTLRLKQDFNTNPRFFIMPVKIRITFVNGVLDTTLFNNQQEQAWVMNFKDKIPTNIDFDPDNWLLKDIVATTEISEEVIPSDYQLFQNYPNPFNPTTTIRYTIPSVMANLSNQDNEAVVLRQSQSEIPVTLKIYDIIGREVATLVNEKQKPGTYSYHFSVSNLQLTSGTYFYQLKAGEYIQTRKMILMK